MAKHKRKCSKCHRSGHYISTCQNKRKKGIRRKSRKITPKIREEVEFDLWEGLPQREIAKKRGIFQPSVSKMAQETGFGTGRGPWKFGTKRIPHTSEIIEEIKFDLWEGVLTQSEIAEKYRLSQGTISNIAQESGLKGHGWRRNPQRKKKQPKKRKGKAPQFQIVDIPVPEDADPRVLRQIEEQFERQEVRQSGPPRPSDPRAQLSSKDYQIAKIEAEKIARSIPETTHYMSGGQGVCAYIWAKIGDKDEIVGSTGSSRIEDIVEAQRKIMEIPGIKYAWHNLD